MNPEELTQIIEKRVAELLGLLQIEGTIQVDIVEMEEKKYVQVVVKSEEGGAELIGHRGGRLKALSTIINMMLPRTEERYSVLLDVNNYRDQRSQYIIDLTTKAMEQAIDSMEDVKLQPMAAWERRIVHMTAADRTDITTSSTGEGDDRSVVVSPVSVI